MPFALSDTVCIFGEGKRKKSHVTVLAFYLKDNYI